MCSGKAVASTMPPRHSCLSCGFGSARLFPPRSRPFDECTWVPMEGSPYSTALIVSHPGLSGVEIVCKGRFSAAIQFYSPNIRFRSYLPVGLLIYLTTKLRDFFSSLEVHVILGIWTCRERLESRLKTTLGNFPLSFECCRKSMVQLYFFLFFFLTWRWISTLLWNARGKACIN